MKNDKQESADKIVGSTDMLDVTVGQRSLGELIADALWAKSCGVYYGSTMDALVGQNAKWIGITKDRYDEVIRPEIERLVSDIEKLTGRLTSNAAVHRRGHDSNE